MRRLFLVLLIVLLPFQACWAVAAGYCQHDAGATAQQHFGHHAHVHPGNDESGSDRKFVHTDCVACHLVSAQALLGGGLALDPAPAAHRPAMSDPHFLAPSPVFLPERPQWAHLA